MAAKPGSSRGAGAMHYGCIIDGGVTVAERPFPKKELKDKFQDTLDQVTSTIRNQEGVPDHRKSAAGKNAKFHYIYSQEVAYLIVASEEMALRSVFGCLEAVQTEYEKFKQKGGKIAKSEAMSRVLYQKMDYFGDPKNDALIANIMLAEDVKQIMIDNLDAMLERGALLEQVVKETDALVDKSKGFKTSAKKLETVYWWKNMKMKIALIAVIIILIAIVVMAGCGFSPFFGRCKGS